MKNADVNYSNSYLNHLNGALKIKTEFFFQIYRKGRLVRELHLNLYV